MKALVLDGDYVFNKANEPVVRLFGKRVGDEKEGDDVVIHILGFEPYIYIGNCGINIFELQKMVEVAGKGFIKRVEIVKRYLPVGYQVEKTNMLRLVLFSPKTVPELRKLLKEKIPEITDSQMYEADITFINRCMVDLDISGMDVIQFMEKGKELQNYGINCNNLYILNKSEIRVLKEEMVKIEY